MRTDDTNGFNYEGFDTALSLLHGMVGGQYIGAGAIALHFGNRAQAVGMLEQMDKFAFGPMTFAIVATDQGVKAYGDIVSGVNPASAIAGHSINTGITISGGYFMTDLATVAADTALGTEGGPVGWGLGAAVGLGTVMGLSANLPTGQQWNSAFQTYGQNIVDQGQLYSGGP